MPRTFLYRSFFLVALSWAISGCAGAPVKVGDNNVERSLQQVSGLTTADVQTASQKPVLNLWDVYALAVKHTEDLANKAENIEQAEAQSQQAIAGILPQISLNGSKGFQSNSYVGPNAAAFQSFVSVPSTALYLSGSTTIFTGLNQVAALQGAQATKDQNNHLYKQEGRNLLLAVARSYYAVLQLEDSQQSKEEIIKLNEQILKQEQEWKAMGRSRDSDVLTTQAQLAQLRGDLESIHSQLSIARDNLIVLAALKSDQPLKSEEQVVLPTYALTDAESKVDERSDVIAAKAGADLADAELLQAHGTHLPSLNVQGNYYLDKEGSSPSPEWTVQLVASLPIFDGLNSFAEERLAASKKRQAENQYTLTRRQALQDIRGAYHALATTQRELDAYSLALDAAQKNYQAVLRDRRLALNTNLDVLQALTLLQTAQDNFNQAHYQSLTDWIWLGVATGELPKIQKTN